MPAEIIVECTEAQYREMVRRAPKPVTVRMYCPRCYALGITPLIPSALRRNGGFCHWCINMRAEDHRLRVSKNMVTWAPDARQMRK